MALSQILKNAFEFAFGNNTVGKQAWQLLQMLDMAPAEAVFSIGAEAADVITVGVQLNNAHGLALDAKHVVDVYLSDASDGDGVVATAASGGIAAGTDGALLATIVTGKICKMQCEADGDLDIAITHSGAKVLYLVIVTGAGKTLISEAITFAA